MKFSIILPAYREKNLDKLIDSLLGQRLPKDIVLEKIVVVACDCELPKMKNKKVIIVNEKSRKGKASAINSALKLIKSEIIVLESVDTTPRKNTLKELLEPFKDPAVGMTASRPIPLNDKNEFTGFLVHLVWSLHHIISLQRPKVGEMLAFRRVFDRIPRKLATDESFLEFIISKKGYNISYIPTAVIFNKGPTSLKYFTKQRRRIFNGHLHIKEKYGYSVSTANSLTIGKALYKYLKTEGIRNYKEFIWIPLAICVEAHARLLATLDFYLLKKLPYKWEKIK